VSKDSNKFIIEKIKNHSIYKTAVWLLNKMASGRNNFGQVICKKSQKKDRYCYDLALLCNKR
jgi:hypothetical protein